MFRFQHSSYFWLLALIPLLILAYLYFLAWRRRKINKLGKSKNARRLIKGKINGRLTTKVVLMCLALFCIVLGLANLQAGGHPVKNETKGLDVMFVLDVSNSMLAKDIKPNRLKKAKELIYRTLENLKNDRMGLVIFAGNAYLQVPITTDYGAVKMLLNSVNPAMIPTQGTNFSSAIQLAAKSFDKNEKKNKVIILISDGEDHDKKGIDAAKKAGDNGVIIYTVGVGSPRGSTIYNPKTQKPMVDRNGKVVITKLNEDELKRIAQAANGQYQLLKSSGEVAHDLVSTIQKLDKKNLGTVVYTDYKSYYQYFFGVGLLLLIISWLLPEAKKTLPASPKKHPQKEKKGTSLHQPIITLLILPLFLAIGMSAPKPLLAQQKKKKAPTSPGLPFKKNINKANQNFKEHKFNLAQKQYQKALKKHPDSYKGNFNLGDAYYQNKNLEKARSSFGHSLKTAKTKQQKALAYHNIGNSYLREKKWQKAAEAFKKSLLRNPNDHDTKYNLAYAQEMMRHHKNKNNNNKKNNKNNKNNNNQKKKKKNEKKQQPKQDQNQDQDQKRNQKKKQQRQTQPSKLTKQQAKNILNALNQEEKKLHKKKKKGKGVPVQPEKDW